MPTFRFAPSPNGRLHAGHALSAITGFTMARRAGGRFLVRIEDIDTTRARPDLIEGILEDLRWLGLEWDGPVLCQSQHFATYQRAAAQLVDLGVLYPCFASRTQIAAALPNGDALDPEGAPLYPGVDKGLSAGEVAHRKGCGEPFALRIDMDRALGIARARRGSNLEFTGFDADGRTTTVTADPARWGDAVIVRKEVPASYHLACVIDDARQGVTHVTRGLDLLAATDIHVLLQVLLGLPTPLYHHHRLLTDGAGRKLAKSAGDTSLAQLRADGLAPAALWALAGFAAPEQLQ